MGVSEVAYGDRTIMSITDSTVTEDTLADGAVAYGADGERIVGKMTMGLPVGHEWFTTNPNIPTGCLPLLGDTYSRAAYADLWAWVQTQTGYLISEAEWQEKAAANGGNVACYSDGDGSTTFRVPSLKCWVCGASGIEKVGSYLAAGLPNATGGLALRQTCNTSGSAFNVALAATGAFSRSDGTGSYNASAITDTKTTTQQVKIDLSQSNSIYGNSDTVQPPSIVGMYLVKAFGTVSNVGNQDIADLSAGLTRVETDLSALETDLSTAVVGASISGKNITLTKADGTTQTLTTQDTNNISAAQTAAKGYLKFNNGITLQWGTITRDSTNTFPLAFTTIYNLLTALGDGEKNNYCTQPSAITTTGFTEGVSRGTYYLAIGKI